METVVQDNKSTKTRISTNSLQHSRFPYRYVIAFRGCKSIVSDIAQVYLKMKYIKYEKALQTVY